MMILRPGDHPLLNGPGPSSGWRRASRHERIPSTLRKAEHPRNAQHGRYWIVGPPHEIRPPGKLKDKLGGPSRRDFRRKKDRVGAAPPVGRNLVNQGPKAMSLRT